MSPGGHAQGLTRCGSARLCPGACLPTRAGLGWGSCSWLTFVATWTSSNYLKPIQRPVPIRTSAPMLMTTVCKRSRVCTSGFSRAPPPPRVKGTGNWALVLAW